LEGDESRQVAKAIDHARFVERFGLLPMSQNTLRLAWFHLLDGDESEFEARIRRVLDEHPDNAALYENLARFYETRGRKEEALKAYENVLDLHPSAVLYDRFAMLLWNMGKRDLSRAAYEEAIVKNPNNADLHFNLGIVHDTSGRPEEAIGAFEEVLRLDPDRVAACENLGRSLCSLDRFTEAIPYLRRALELAPSEDCVFFLVGALLESGAADAARTETRNAIARGWISESVGRAYEDRIDKSGK
jgi:tetratricopeptide (TPR) repeat protein